MALDPDELYPVIIVEGALAEESDYAALVFFQEDEDARRYGKGSSIDQVFELIRDRLEDLEEGERIELSRRLYSVEELDAVEWEPV